MARARRRGANLFECLVLMGLLLAGLYTGALASSRFGILGFVIAAPLGTALVGFVLWLLAATAAALFEGLLPRCHSGTCRGRFSSLDGDYEFDIVEGHNVYICGCLRQYRRMGRRFLERLPDGTLRPYLAFRPLRGWAPDTGPAPEEEHAAPATEGPDGAVVADIMQALRAREDLLEAFELDALWVLDRTGCSGVLQEGEGSGEAAAFHIEAQGEQWRTQLRRLFSQGTGAREDNSWGFGKPQAKGDLYRQGLRVVQDITCDGRIISTYDSTTGKVKTRRTASPRVTTRRPLCEAWLLGVSFRPQRFAALQPGSLVLLPQEVMVDGRSCRVLVTERMEGRRFDPEDSHLLAIYVCPELGYTALRVDSVLFGHSQVVEARVHIALELSELAGGLHVPGLYMCYDIAYVGDGTPRCTRATMMRFHNVRVGAGASATTWTPGTAQGDLIPEATLETMHAELQEGFPPMPEEFLMPPSKEAYLAEPNG